jgi:hypothetical protein
VAFVGLLLLASLVATLPIATVAGTALPGNLGDPLLNAWAIGWGADRLAHGLSDFWHAPVFHPHGHALAYSEHLLGVTLFVAPVYWLTGNAILAHNAAFVLSYAHAGLGMYLLARYLTGRRDAAALAALAFAFGPYRTAGPITHVQFLVSGWLPIALWLLHRYLASGSRRALAGFAAAFVLQVLTSLYFLSLIGVAVALIGAAGLISAGHRWWGRLAGLAVAGLVIAAALAPVIAVYRDVGETMDLGRSLEENARYSADMGSYLSVWHEARALPWLGRETTAVRALFPGSLLLMLAAAGALFGSRVTRAPGRPALWPYAVLGAAALLLSLGPTPTAFGERLMEHGPYRWLLDAVPPLEGLRMPARFGLLVVLVLAIFGARGATFLLRSCPTARWRSAVALAAGLVVLAEGVQAPVPVAAIDPGGRATDRAVHDWLAAQPEGAVLILPIADEDFAVSRTAGVSTTLYYQYATLLHGRRLVNGATEFTPVLHQLLAGGASPVRKTHRLEEALAMLRTLGVRVIVVYRQDFGDAAYAASILATIRGSAGHVTAEHDLGTAVGFVLAPAPAPAPAPSRGRPVTGVKVRVSHEPDRAPLLVDRNPETRWLTGKPQTGDEWIEIHLDGEQLVGGVRLEATRRSVGNYPRRLLVESSDGTSGWVIHHDGGVLAKFALGLASEPARAPIHVPFAEGTRARVIRLRQTGATASDWFWAVHEIEVYAKDPTP